MAFSLTERSPDWVPTAPVHHSDEVSVGADPAKVFDTLADHAGWPTWFRGMTKVVPDGTGQGVGGTRNVWIGPVRAKERMTAWDPGTRFAFTVVEANAPGLRSLAEVFDLSPTSSGGTTVRYTIGVEGIGPRAILQPGLELALRRLISGGLRGLSAKVG